ncbi:hypothetical protein CPC16_010793 [Podila verticillata]|nr:hypothetical protein CPC16_010793 [Podila verticillata]
MNRQIAILMIGNSGAGKSMLLSQLGVTRFTSRNRFRMGFTKDMYEEEIKLNGQRILFIDLPDLHDYRDTATERNAEKLTEALSKEGYDYKLYLVTLATNRGPTDAELVMMSKVNQYIKRTGVSHVSFRVIVNQIMERNTYKLYQELADDNFKSYFKSLDTEQVLPGFKFDITVDSVILLMFSNDDIINQRFKDTIAADVCQRSQYEVKMAKLKFSNKNLELLHKVVSGWRRR